MVDEKLFETVTVEDIEKMHMESGFCMIPKLDKNITIEENGSRVYAYILSSRSGIIGENRNDVMRCLLNEAELVQAMYDCLVDATYDEYQSISVLDCLSGRNTVKRHKYAEYLREEYNVSCYYKI